MTAAPTPALGSPGVDRFTPTQLLRTARLFATDPALPTLVDAGSGESHWVKLDSSPYLEIWLISWPAGTHNGWHDHGQSAGAFQVVTGTLLEQTPYDECRQDSTLIAGQGRSFGESHIHHLANVGVRTALSVHVYAPRLTMMTRYAAAPGGLRPGAVTRLGLNR
jgi:hypothetical protein